MTKSLPAPFILMKLSFGIHRFYHRAYAKQPHRPLISSVNVWLRKREGVADQLDSRLFRTTHQHFDDIEAEKNVGIVEHAQPCERTARDAPLLVRGDRLERPPEFFASARFHFDEDKGVAITADEVELTAAAATKIPIQNFVAVPTKKAAREFFSGATSSQMLRARP